MNYQNILMVVIALVLGMLVANMLKDVCGCKDLVEGQCTDPDNCAWVLGVSDGEGLCGPSYSSKTTLCENGVGVGGDTGHTWNQGDLGYIPMFPNDFNPDQSETAPEIIYWSQSTCCTSPVRSATASAGPPPRAAAAPDDRLHYTFADGCLVEDGAGSSDPPVVQQIAGSPPPPPPPPCEELISPQDNTVQCNVGEKWTWWYSDGEGGVGNGMANTTYCTKTVGDIPVDHVALKDSDSLNPSDWCRSTFDDAHTKNPHIQNSWNAFKDNCCDGNAGL